MRILHTIVHKRFYLYAVGLVAATGILAANSFQGQTSAQGTDSIYLTPANGSYNVGDNFTVTVRENSSTQVNAAQADLSYPTANLQFVSIDGTGSAFGIDASSNGGNGSVSVARGNTSAVSGDQLVAKVTFKVLGAGTASVQMDSSSVVLSSSNNSNVASTRNGGNYTLVAPSTPGPTPAPNPTPTPAPTPSPSPGSTPSPSPTTSLISKPSPSPTVTVAPNGNTQTTPLPGDSTVELSAPATVETTPGTDKDVTKVEYYVNGKVVATVSKAPYSYSVDTTKYRNGKYTLTTKTYYKNGKIDSSNAALIVKNPFSSRQLFLQLRHYAWLIIILLIVAGELVWMRFFKHRSYKNPYSGSTTGFGSAGPTPPSDTPSSKPTIVVGGSSAVTGVPTAVVRPSSGINP